MPYHIYYHDHCADGFASYVIVRQNLEWAGETQVHGYACQYDKPLPVDPLSLPEGDPIYFVDFTPEVGHGGADLLMQLARTHPFSLYDHHETAFWHPATKDRPAGPGPLLKLAEMSKGDGLRPIVYYSPSRQNAEPHQALAKDYAGWILTNSNQSAAGMVWPRAILNPIVELIQYRDLGYTWTRATEEPTKAHQSRAIHAALMRVVNRRYHAWAPLLDPDNHPDTDTENLNWLTKLGNEILIADAKAIELAIRSPFTISLEGHQVPSVITDQPHLISELGNALLKAQPSAPFAAVLMHDPETQKTKVSLRGRPDGINVGHIAVKFGGGGHAQAAGYSRQD